MGLFDTFMEAAIYVEAVGETISSTIKEKQKEKKQKEKEKEQKQREKEQKQKEEFDKLSIECLKKYLNRLPFKGKGVYGIAGCYNDDRYNSKTILVYDDIEKLDSISRRYTKLVLESEDEFFLVFASLSRIFPVLESRIPPFNSYHFSDKSLGRLDYLKDYITKTKSAEIFNCGSKNIQNSILTMVDIWFKEYPTELYEEFGNQEYYRICDELKALKEEVDKYREEEKLERTKIDEERKLKKERLEEEKRLEEERQEAEEKRDAIIKAGVKGEDEVSYALKYLDNGIVIDKNSNNGNSVKVQNLDYIDEAQEIDHMVVGDFGLVLIETKAYSGNIEIDENGNWVREKYDGAKVGEINPIQQVRRHEKVLKSFLDSEIPVNSIICLANSKVIINGIENSVIPIVKSDMLVEFIETKFDRNVIDEDVKNNVLKTIKSHMVE